MNDHDDARNHSPVLVRGLLFLVLLLAALARAIGAVFLALPSHNYALAGVSLPFYAMDSLVCIGGLVFVARWTRDACERWPALPLAIAFAAQLTAVLPRRWIGGRDWTEDHIETTILLVVLTVIASSAIAVHRTSRSATILWVALPVVGVWSVLLTIQPWLPSPGFGQSRMDGAIHLGTTLLIVVGLALSLFEASTGRVHRYMAGIATALAAAGAVLFWLNERTIPRGRDWLQQSLGAVVSLATVAILVCIAIRLPRKGHSGESRVVAWAKCPRCEEPLPAQIGSNDCSACHLRFDLRIDPQECPSCGYDLTNTSARTCPECGTAF